jgi:PncC family amidohydrolase
LTNVPGSSGFFWGGIVSYSNPAKHRLLKVPLDLLARHGPVSQAVTVRMSKNVRAVLKTDLGIAITGNAGPTGNPLGLVHIAVSTRHKVIFRAFQFNGSRLSIKKKAVSAAIDLLAKALCF